MHPLLIVWRSLTYVLRVLVVLVFVVWIGAAYLNLLHEPGLQAVTSLADPLATVLLAVSGAVVANEGVRTAVRWRQTFNVIDLPRGMVRRTREIRAVQKQLLSLGDRTPRVVIVGMGGTGKTILALHVVYGLLVRLKFRSRVLWLQADQLDTRAMLRKIADHFVPDAIDRQQPTAAYLSDVTAGLSGKRTLVVLDDLPEALTGDSDLGLLLKLPCAFLITGRCKLGRNVKEITLVKLTRKEWSALLFNRLATKSSIFAGWIDKLPFLWEWLGSGKLDHWKGVVGRIWDVVEGHPLALSIIAGDVAAQTEIVPGEYVDALEAARLDELDRGTSAEASVRASLRVSYDRLRDDADRARFAQLGMRNGPDLPFPFVHALWGEDERATRHHLRQFAWRHLVEPTGQQRWRLHVLVGKYADECLNQRNADRAQASGRLAQYYAAYVTQHIAADKAALTEEWPDLQYAMDWAVLAQEDEAAVELALRIQPFFNDRRWWSIKRSWLENAREPASRLPRQGPLLDLLEALGGMYLGSGTLEKAQDCYAEAVRALQAGDDDPLRRARLLEALGGASAGLGQYRDAGGSYNEARQLYQQVADWERQVRATSHLFRLLMRQHRQREAAELCGRRYADAVRRTLAGKPACAHMVSDLGDLAAAEGDIEKAARQYNEALQILQTEDLPGQAWVHYRRGRLMLQMGDHQSAHRNYQQALSLYRSGPDFQGFARMLEALGDAELSQYRFGTAEAYYARALGLYDIVGDRPGQLHTRGRSAEIAAMRGDLAKAEVILEAALADHDYWQVEEPWWQASIMEQLARVEELRWNTGIPDPLLHENEAGSKLARAQQLYIAASELYAQLEQPMWQVQAIYRAAALACLRRNRSEGREYYQRASVVYGSLGQSWQQAETADQAAYLAEWEGDWLSAAIWYHVAEQAYADLSARPWQAQASYRTARSLESAGEFACASGEYWQAAESYGRLGQVWWQSELVYCAALASEHAGLPDQTQSRYEQAATLYERLGQPRWQVESVYRAARVAERRGLLAEASAHYTTAADLYKLQGEAWRCEEAMWRVHHQAIPSSQLADPESGDRSVERQEIPVLSQDSEGTLSAGNLAKYVDELRRSGATCQEAFAALGRLGYPLAQAEASHRAAWILELLDNQAEAVNWYRNAADTYRELEPWSWAESTYRAARCAERLGRLDEAKEWYEEALGVYHQLGEQMLQACIASNLAWLHERRNNLAEASNAHKLESTLYEQLKCLPRQVEATVRSARLAEQCGEPALDYYDQAADTYRRLNAFDYQAEATYRAAQLAEQSGRLKTARDRYLEIAILFDKLRKPWRQAEAICRVAGMSLRLWLFAEAKTHYQDAMGKFRELAEPWWEAEAAYWAGYMAELLGDVAEAGEKYQQVILVARQQALDPMQVARAHTGFGRLATIQERYDEARKRLETATRLIGERGGTREHLHVGLALGELDLLEYKLADAEAELNWARNEALENNLISEHIDACLGLGRIPIVKSNCLRIKESEAEELEHDAPVIPEKRKLEWVKQDFDASLSRAEAEGYRLGEVKAHNALAELAFLQDTYAEACEHLKLALSLASTLEVAVEHARALVLLGRIALIGAEYDGAIESLTTARDLVARLGARRHEADTLSLLGKAALGRGDYEDAQDWLQEGFLIYTELGDTARRVDILLLLAEVDLAQDYPGQAGKRCEEATRIYETLGRKGDAAMVYYRFARRHEKHNYLSLAADYCIEALNVASDPSSPSFDKIEHYLGEIGKRMSPAQRREWRKSHTGPLPWLGDSE